MTVVGYRLSLANRIERGRTVGNLYGVSVTVRGAHRYYLLEPQRDETLAIYVWELLTGRTYERSCEVGYLHTRWERPSLCPRAEPLSLPACGTHRFDRFAADVLAERLDCDQILAGPEKDPLGGNVCEGR